MGGSEWNVHTMGVHGGPYKVGEQTPCVCSACIVSGTGWAGTVSTEGDAGCVRALGKYIHCVPCGLRGVMCVH